MKPRCLNNLQIKDKVYSYLSIMSVKYKHSDIYSLYFCTFTCYKWMHLFTLTDGHDLVYNWFNVLKEGKIEEVIVPIAIGMPNHVHSILYFSEAGFSLNKTLSCIGVSRKEYYSRKIMQ